MANRKELGCSALGSWLLPTTLPEKNKAFSIVPFLLYCDWYYYFLASFFYSVLPEHAFFWIFIFVDQVEDPALVARRVMFAYEQCLLCLGMLSSRVQWFWNFFRNSICFMCFWFGREILRLVYKKVFLKYWTVSILFELLSFGKSSTAPYKSWKKNVCKIGRAGYQKKRNCATDFSLLNLPKGKSLGRSKPATNS